MPDIPNTTPLGYVGILALAFGIFLILAGLGIINFRQIDVKPGPKTWGFGIFITLLGIIFLLPNIIVELSQFSTPTPAVEIAADTSIDTPIPPPDLVEEAPSPSPTAELSTNTPELAPDTPIPKSTNTPQPTNTPRPSTPTPTPVPTNTPIPTNTPPPTPTPIRWIEGDVLFEDNFESRNIVHWSTWGQKWSVIQDNTDNYVLQSETANDYAGINAGNSTWENYAFEAKVYVAKFGTADYGETFSFIFRASDDYCTRYKWIINQGGLNLLREKAPNCILERQLRWNNYQLPLNTWITVRVEVFDDIIRGYINNQEIVRITDEQPRLKGRIAIEVAPNCTVWFDDVRVVELRQQ